MLVDEDNLLSISKKYREIGFDIQTYIVTTLLKILSLSRFSRHEQKREPMVLKKL